MFQIWPEQVKLTRTNISQKGARTWRTQKDPSAPRSFMTDLKVLHGKARAMSPFHVRGHSPCSHGAQALAGWVHLCQADPEHHPWLQSVWSCVPKSYSCRLTQTWFEAWLNLKAPHWPDLALAKLYVIGGGLNSSVRFLSQCPKHEPSLQLWLSWSITLWQMRYQHKFHILHCNLKKTQHILTSKIH